MLMDELQSGRLGNIAQVHADSAGRLSLSGWLRRRDLPRECRMDGARCQNQLEPDSKAQRKQWPHNRASTR